MVATYQQRRDILVCGVNVIPRGRCRVPIGVFFAFPNLRFFNLSSGQIANLLLEEAQVALLPGTS